MVGYRTCLVLWCTYLALLHQAQTHVLKDIPPPAIFLNTNREISEGLYEGDIVLTPEQKLPLMQRKAIGPASYWPRDSSGTVTIGYRFGDDIIDQDLVKVAIAHWEQHTCLRFKEVSSDVGYTHLNFIDSTACASYVGRTSMISGQTVYLHPSCVTEVGPAVHEIGHALGFNHEQSRSDRDDYVEILWDNVVEGMEHNFAGKVTFNYEIPYDFWSVMHYGPSYFSSNRLETIRAYDPLAQILLGNRIGLSFTDKLQANTMYGCLDQWFTECSMTSNPCDNLGYTGPDCSCVCPEGTSGARCEVLEDSYTDALVKIRSPHSERITTEGVVSTPGYPTPIQARTKFTKVLTAPDGYHVKLTFTDFQVYYRYYTTCAIDSLTVRTSASHGTGTEYCNEEIVPGTIFISETNTIVLYYYNYDYTTVSWDSPFRGFNATIEHVPADQCTPTTTVPPRVTFINTGDVSLVKYPSSRGPCNLKSRSSAGEYELTSRWYPRSYWPGDSCSVDTVTSEPRYLKVTAADIRIGSSDSIDINSLYGTEKSITREHVGNSYIIPSSSTNIFFKALTWWFGRGFKLVIDVLNTDCHQIVRLEAGASETLSITNYASDTVCEWWIQAPTGSEIQLDFSTFAVGPADCSADYVSIVASGVQSHVGAPQQFCGTNSPGSVTSSGGQLNVLFSGIQGGDTGFTATYSVV